MPHVVARFLAVTVLLVGLAACSTTSVVPAPAEPTPAAVASYEALPLSAAFEIDTDGDGAKEAVESIEEEVESQGRNPWHEFTLGVGMMVVADFDTEIRVDSKKYGNGTELSFENLLGLDDNAALARVGTLYRFNRASMIGLSWYDIRRKGDRKINRSIEIGDEIYEAGAVLDTELSTDIYRFSYWWNFVAEDDYELGVGIGIYWMRLYAAFSGRGRAAGSGEETSGKVEETYRSNFPPPLIGLRGAYAITPRLRAIGTFEILYVPVDSLRGWIVDVNLGLEWDVFDWAGLALSYNYFDLGVDADQGSFEGTFDYRFHALVASIYVYF